MDTKKNTGRYEYGMASITVVNKTTGEFIGSATDVAEAIYNEKVDMTQADVGGSARFSRDVQVGKGEASLKLTLNNKPFWWFEAFNGKKGTVTTAEASGNVSAISNIFGSSVVNSSTGIASAAVIPSTGAANLKYGRIYLIAASATTVDVYSEKSEAPIVSGLTITSGATITIAALGVQIVGGAGTIGMTAGDQAVITTRPKNNGFITINTTGEENIPELEITIYGQELINKQQSKLTVYRCMAYGVNAEFKAKEYAKPTIELVVLQPIDGSSIKTYEALDRV